jgi:hypothetical protein
MPPAGFQPVVPASERPQTLALVRLLGSANFYLYSAKLNRRSILHLFLFFEKLTYKERRESATYLRPQMSSWISDLACYQF